RTAFRSRDNRPESARFGPRAAWLPTATARLMGLRRDAVRAMAGRRRWVRLVRRVAHSMRGRRQHPTPPLVGFTRAGRSGVGAELEDGIRFAPGAPWVSPLTQHLEGLRANILERRRYDFRRRFLVRA